MSAGNTGVLNGNQVLAPIQAPINICGIAVGVLGSATASCDGGAIAARPGPTTLVSYGNTGVLNGNQVYAPVQAPINICGTGVSVAGSATASCKGGASANKPGHHKGYRMSESMSRPSRPVQKPSDGKHRQHDWWLVTHDNTGVGNGNQVYVPVQIPINICGIAIGVLGNATASCVGGASAIAW